MMREFGSANRMSFWPAASSSDAMEAAWPTHSQRPFVAQSVEDCRARFDSDCARLTVDGQFHGYGIDTRRTGNGSTGRFTVRSAAGAAFPSLAHFDLARATSAALIPSNASPYPTP